MNTRPVKATDLGVARRRLRWARAFVSAAALRPAIVAAFLAASALAQQAPEVPVQGEVKDSTGAVLASASVRIFRGEELVAATQTNEQGQFSFRAAPGEYRIEIEAADFSPHEEKIFIRSGIAAFSFTLELAPVLQRMEVQDEPLQISLEPDKNLSSLTLDAATIQQELPDDEDEMLALLQEMAGPAAGAAGGAELSVDGFTDGRLPPKEQIREVRINNNPFSAESSRPGRGRIEIITRAGTDQLHGSVRLETRNDVLNARNAFATTRPPYHRNDWRANLGGPLIKNHLSFAFGLRRMDTQDNDALQAITPSGIVSDAVLRPNHIREYNGRIEAQLPQNHFLSLAVSYRDNVHENQGVGGFTLPERATDSDDSEFSVQARDTMPLSERMMHELRFGAERGRDSTTPRGMGFAVNVQDAFNGGGATRLSRDTNNEYQFASTLTYSRARLTVKGGFQGVRRVFDIFSADNFNGTFVFRDLASYIAGQPLTFTQTVGNPALKMAQFEAASFVQADYRLTPKFMLSAGLRHEAQTNIDDHNNFDPRLGFAYGVGAKSVIRGGAGFFHQRLSAGTVQSLLQLDGTRQVQTVIRYCEAGDSGDCIPPSFPDPFAFGSAAAIAPSVRRRAADLALPYTANASLSYETQLSRTLFSSITYEFIRGLHLYRARNINAPLPGETEPPDPRFQNVLLLESSAGSRYQGLSLRLNWRLRGTSLSLNYTLGSSYNNTDGTFSLPADSYNLQGEWGRASDYQRHTLFANSSFQLPWKLGVSTRVRANSGRPYNITTGNDDNHDTITNDRPPGVGRNTGEGPGFFEIDMTLRRSFSLKRASAPAGGPRGAREQGGGSGGQARPAAVASRAGEAPARAGTAQPAAGGGGASARAAVPQNRGSDQGSRDYGDGGASGGGNRGPQLTLAADINNVLNHTNFSRYSGVLTSPFFGRANSAREARSVEISIQLSF